MICHAIETARSCGIFDRVVVSTDDREIAQVARASGADVPFIRPAELADDHTPTVPVIAHAIVSCENLGWNPEQVCCIYAATPFLSADDLHGALGLLEQSGADYAFPVAEYPSAVQRALARDAHGRLAPLFPEHELTRTQDLPKAYHDTGQFYWGFRSAWLTNPRIHSGGAGYVIPAWRVVDIDTSADWERAEILYRTIYTAPKERAD
jgi:pseudaminic acid cytidylyltransferase